MVFRTRKKQHRAYAILSVWLLLCVMLGGIGVTTARYQQPPFSSTVYGEELSDNTVGPERRIYDFGGWTLGAEQDPTATIVLHQHTPLKGVLRFAFDYTTAAQRDVSLFTEWGLAGNGGTYTVNEEDGHIALPFSLIVSTSTRSGVVHLDVEWIPDNVAEPTQSARYLLTLNQHGLCADVETPPAIGSTTEFLTDRLLRLSLQPPTTAPGLIVANGSTLNDVFAAGLRYYTPLYPQGVLLLQDSTVYLPMDGSDSQEILLNFHQIDVSPIRIAVGTSDGYLATTAQTPASKVTSLHVTAEEPAIVNKTQSWTVTLNEAPLFHDAMWNNHLQEDNQLMVTLQRFVNGAFVDAEPSEDLVCAITQTENSGTVTVSAPTGKQPAGTYQLLIQQTWNGYPLHTQTIPFFIDYR